MNKRLTVYLVGLQVVLLDFGACRGYPEAFTDDYIQVRLQAAA